LGKLGIVFSFPDIQQGFIQPDLILVLPVIEVGLADLQRIFVIDRPESLGFFGGQVQSFGDECDSYKTSMAPTLGPVLARTLLRILSNAGQNPTKRAVPVRKLIFFIV